jgi:hypothetical protein
LSEDIYEWPKGRHWNDEFLLTNHHLEADGFSLANERGKRAPLSRASFASSSEGSVGGRLRSAATVMDRLYYAGDQHGKCSLAGWPLRQPSAERIGQTANSHTSEAVLE